MEKRLLERKEYKKMQKHWYIAHLTPREISCSRDYYLPRLARSHAPMIITYYGTLCHVPRSNDPKTTTYYGQVQHVRDTMQHIRSCPQLPPYVVFVYLII